MENENIVKLANLIMINYYLGSELEIHDADFSVKEVELIRAALNECGGSTKTLEAILDEYIKSNDWTECLGSAGSGNRERSIAIEGALEAHPIYETDFDESQLNKIFDKILREVEN